MKRIVKIFGEAALMGACIVMFVIMLTGVRDDHGNEGILEMAGALLETEQTQRTGTAFDIYEEESVKGFPEVEYIPGQSLRPGEYALDLIVDASDYAGNPARITVDSLTEPDGTVQEVRGRTELNFPVRGIYALEITVRDDGNRECRKRICIPVS